MSDATPQPRGTRFRLGDQVGVTELAFVVGAAMVTYGVSLIYEPAAFIVGGGFLLAGSWLAARAGL